MNLTNYSESHLEQLMQRVHETARKHGRYSKDLAGQLVAIRAERARRMVTFAGMENAPADRAQARAEAEGQELTEEMRRSKADVSAKAGRMERESPLFYGTGANPTLFS